MNTDSLSLFKAASRLLEWHNSMEQVLPEKLREHQIVNKFPHLWNKIHKGPPPVPILNLIYPIHDPIRLHEDPF
jgi:hypothetical protein